MTSGEIVTLEVRFLKTPYQHLRIRDRRAERTLLASLEEHGQQFPITVIPAGTPDEYVVIDGDRRVAGLKRLGRDLVRAQVLAMPAGEALLWIRIGQASAPLTALEQALLIQELVDTEGLELDVVALRLGRTKSWVSRRLDLIRVLSPAIQRLVVAGKIPAHSAMKCLVPVARANAAHAEVLATAIADAQLSTRDIERLYGHYRSGCAAIREELLANPLRFLKAEDAYKRASGQPDSAEQEVVERLERLSAMLMATTSRVRKLTRDGIGPAWAKTLVPACALALEACQALTGVVTPILEHIFATGWRA